MVAAIVLTVVGGYLLFWESEVLVTGGHMTVRAMVATAIPFALGLLWLYSKIRAR